MVALSVAGIIGSALFAMFEMASFFMDQRGGLPSRRGRIESDPR